MNTFFSTQDILGVGYDMATQAMTAAWTIFAVTAPVSFAIALIRHATGSRHPFSMLFQIGGLVLALGFYSGIVSVIDGLGQSAASAVGQGGNFMALLNSYQASMDANFTTASAANSSTLGSIVDVATALGSGMLSGLLTMIGSLAVIVALHLYQIIQAVLYGVLVAVGPIVLAVSIIPGAASLRSRWLMALFELAMWPIVGAVIFEMIGKALLKMRTGQTQDFVSAFVSNVVLVFCVFLVPKISARLVGSGFGAIGDAFQNALSGAAGGIAGAAIGAGAATVPKVASVMGNAASGAISGVASAVSGPAPYQPPANGGPQGGFSSAPSMREREANPEAPASAPSGPHAADETPHDPTERNHPVHAGSFNPQITAEKWGGGPATGNRRRERGLAGTVGPISEGAKGEGGAEQAPARSVALNVAKNRNAEFQARFPGGQVKNGVYWSPDKVQEMQKKGAW